MRSDAPPPAPPPAPIDHIRSNLVGLLVFYLWTRTHQA